MNFVIKKKKMQADIFGWSNWLLLIKFMVQSKLHFHYKHLSQAHLQWKQIRSQVIRTEAQKGIRDRHNFLFKMLFNQSFSYFFYFFLQFHHIVETSVFYPTLLSAAFAIKWQSTKTRGAVATAQKNCSNEICLLCVIMFHDSREKAGFQEI